MVAGTCHYEAYYPNKVWGKGSSIWCSLIIKKKFSNRKQTVKATEQCQSYSGPCQDIFHLATRLMCSVFSLGTQFTVYQICRASSRDIQKKLRLEFSCLYFERIRLRWIRHLISKSPHGVVSATSTLPWCRPEHVWKFTYPVWLTNTWDHPRASREEHLRFLSLACCRCYTDLYAISNKRLESSAT